ncbi:SemiSWEET family sugar transporter [Agrobacterium pusense]|uniref:SemiSWEET family sugar transporter n=1 Tax=Agrobacterium pusense TaxID=648995 RepID=UPI00156B9F9A|nr:SemiSWEET transporter [Agrobacterium pusense]QKJ94697.1 SemiSWEET transporter [Agrobacterium pusense]
MDSGLLVGYLASICSVASFIPQVWKVTRSGDTEAISVRMYMLTVTGFALWTTFGLLRGEWPIIVTNSLCFCLSGIVLFQKLRTRSLSE